MTTVDSAPLRRKRGVIPVQMKRYAAELVGTFILVMVGSMTILSAVETRLVMVPFGFGLGLLAAIYAVGHVSGGHFNPPVTLAIYLHYRTLPRDPVPHWRSHRDGSRRSSFAPHPVREQ